MSLTPANLRIRQGKTFRSEFRWADDRTVYRPITAASNAAPCVLTVPAHGLPADWAFLVTGARGLTQINRGDPADPWTATLVDADQLELNRLNAANAPVYTGGGWVEYQAPVDLAGYEARMQVRPTVESADVLVSLTSEPGGGIVLDNVGKRVLVSLSAAETAALPALRGVYDIEMVSADGDVELLAFGRVEIIPEVTR